jgi:hypothetical protein
MQGLGGLTTAQSSGKISYAIRENVLVPITILCGCDADQQTLLVLKKRKIAVLHCKVKADWLVNHVAQFGKPLRCSGCANDVMPLIFHACRYEATDVATAND